MSEEKDEWMKYKGLIKQNIQREIGWTILCNFK